MQELMNLGGDLKWLKDVKPYVFLRQDNLIQNPGSAFKLNWFSEKPLYKNALRMETVGFADLILKLETLAFSATSLAMPRWVFYDCAVMPGFVAGFALPKTKAPQKLIDILQPDSQEEYLPISLFIAIPAMAPSEWVAHNLCSVNSLLPEDSRYYGLGFLTKAFGLWYANIENLCGMTQWGSPAVRLHTHYGSFEVLTAYTPVHSYAATLTYRMKTDASEWLRFFTTEQSPEFDLEYKYAGFDVDPKAESSLKAFQQELEAGNGPFFLNPVEIRSQPLEQSLRVYKPKL